MALKEQAVLFRTSHHSAMLEIELTRRNIPFVKFGGLKFIEAAHVKDMLAVLRWAENPTDRVTGFRVVQLLAGPRPRHRRQGARRHGRTFRDRCAGDVPPARQGGRCLARSGRADAAPVGAGGRLAGGARPRAAVVSAPSRAALRGRGRARRRSRPAACASPRAIPRAQAFLTDLTLDPPSATSDEAGAPLLDEDYLILSTIHSAKGQEWKAVYVLNVVDGCIPSDMATGSAEEIEEERRLLYVAMTRAKDTLVLVVPHRFYVHNQAKRGDGHVYAARTRFIPAADRTALRAAVLAARPSRSRCRRRRGAPRRQSISPPACAACGGLGPESRPGVVYAGRCAVLAASAIRRPSSWACLA